MAESPRPPDAGSIGASEPSGSASSAPPAGSDTGEAPMPPMPGAETSADATTVTGTDGAPTPGPAPAVAPASAAAEAPAATEAPAAVPAPAATPAIGPVWATAQPAAAAPIPAQPAPPAVAAAEAMARDAAQQIAIRGRAWWGQLDPTGKRPTLLVAAALIALVIGSQFLNALVPVSRGGGGGSQPPVGVPVDIGNGVRVTPPSGWVAVGSPMGQLPGVRFQRGAVTVDIAIVSYSASPRELLIAYVSQVLDSASQDAKVSEPTNVRAGNGRPTARSTYTASFKDIGTAVSGELSTQVSDNGIGIIVNGYAPQGQLAGSLGEVHEFVDTIEVRQ